MVCAVLWPVDPVCRCRFRFGSSDLWFLSLTMVDALLRWSFRILARRFLIRLIQ
jgi:hypothetical protein